MEGSEDRWTRMIQVDAHDDKGFDGFNTCLMFIKNVEAQFDAIRSLEQSVVTRKEEEEEEEDLSMIRISQETTDEFVTILNNAINLVMGLGYLYIFYLIVSAFFNFLHR